MTRNLTDQTPPAPRERSQSDTGPTAARPHLLRPAPRIAQAASIAQAARRLASPVRQPVRDWHRDYASRLVLTDLLVLIWVVFGVQIAWLGFAVQEANFSNFTSMNVSYSLISVATIASWMLTLRIYGTRESRVLGTGTAEYKAIADGTLRLFGMIAILAFLTKLDLARGYILIALPLGLAILVFSRWIWRQWLGSQRRAGKCSSLVLLVGSQASVAHIARELGRQPETGYRVVGACIPGARDASRSAGTPSDSLADTPVPVLGNLECIMKALLASGADTVVITSADDLSPERVRELSWGLEPGRQHLVVAPSLTDIGGPRIHTRPVAGFPLIHVETPSFDGGKRFVKRVFDIVGSGALLLVLSPLLLAVAVLVRVTSRGRVFYRQERVGLNGQLFNMLKFRTMCTDADAQLAGLLKAQGTDGHPLFKVRDDPRLTRVGGFLRKFSLDEFPQLLNVLRGDMSLVGPRPQREGEVNLYDSAAHRRLFVKPGMSGLWQVSGRSNLSWEDSIRLDLYYVENWSLTGDIVILWRTLRAVLVSDGAI